MCILTIWYLGSYFVSLVGISSVTLKIGLFHLLVTDCFMCHVVIVDRYKYKWLRRDSLCICNEFLLLSYILWTQYLWDSVFVSESQMCILFSHFLNILSLCLWISASWVIYCTNIQIYSPSGYGTWKRHVLDAKLSQVEWEQLLHLVGQHNVSPISETPLAHYWWSATFLSETSF